MPDENVAPVGVAGVTGNGDAFHDGGRVAFQDTPVVESAGVALLAVAENVLVGIRVAGQKAPLDPGWKGRPPAPPQPGGSHLAQRGLRRHLGKRLVQGGVTAVGDVLVQVGRVNVAGVPQGNALFPGPHRMVVQMGDAVGGLIPRAQVAEGVFGDGPPAGNMLRHDALRQFGGNIAVENARAAGQLHIQQRLGETQPQRADFRHIGGCAAPRQRIPDGGDDFKPAGRFAGQPGADAHPGPVAGGKQLPATLRLGADGVEGNGGGFVSAVSHGARNGRRWAMV